MTDKDLAREFAKAVGGTLAHVTAAENIDLIEATGLQPAATLAQRAGVELEASGIRRDRLIIGGARLNHQRPILHGLTAAHRMLDGHSPESWARQLDARVFFWPRSRLARFKASIDRDLDTATILVDAETLALNLMDHIDLCAINSGNFTQGGSSVRRGDWIYRPMREGLGSFRRYRMRRGLVKRPDTIGEVSLRCAVSPSLLTACLVYP
ncbi:hypothetical protein [Pseudooctadecabacter sp.]|uniref:DUF7002 family protein n=1 Tax=Pseudooctadecabacter sp. TaxID=1966338 RepID=UPI0035C8738C